MPISPMNPTDRQLYKTAESLNNSTQNSGEYQSEHTTYNTQEIIIIDPSFFFAAFTKEQKTEENIKKESKYT
jgi:hypothetical protein